MGLSATALRPPLPKLLGHRFLKGPCTPRLPTSRKPSQPRAPGIPKNPQPRGTLTRAYCPSMQGSFSPGPPGLDLSRVSLLPLVFVRVRTPSQNAPPLPHCGPGKGVTDSRARKGPYLRLPRLSSPRPLEVEIQLSALHEKLLGDVVCLRSLIPGTRGGGRGSRPIGVLPRAALCPPTYDIQLLTLPMKSCLETDLYSHPDVSPARWGLSAPSHCANTTT